jgi:hypothetical protein
VACDEAEAADQVVQVVRAHLSSHQPFSQPLDRA